MSALEQEVIDKFHQLDREAKDRVHQHIMFEMKNESARRLSEFLDVAKHISAEAQVKNLATTPTLQEMLDEIRGNDE